MGRLRRFHPRGDGTLTGRGRRGGTTGGLACVFCEIVAGEKDAAVVHSGDHTIAFLDHRPLFPGHVLLVPREHHVTLPDLPAHLIEPFFAAAQRLAVAVRDAVGSQGTFVAMNNVVSQSVPHLHVHVVPRTRGDKLRGFFWPRHPYRDETHMEQVRAAIAAAMA